MTQELHASGQSAPQGATAGGTDGVLHDVDAGHPQTVLRSHPRRHVARPAARVQHVRAGGQVQAVASASSMRRTAARMRQPGSPGGGGPRESMVPPKPPRTSAVIPG